MTRSPSRGGAAGIALLGGVLLVVCTAIALVLANSPIAAAFNTFWHHQVAFTLADAGLGDSIGLSKSLLHWINDGLMALFFFAVGLELKREFLYGELADPRKAALPMAAAVGGMVVPAAVYALWNVGGPGAAGWGIPMATDIAFALGMLALLGKRVPASLRIFLATLAVVDDLGAILVIALFYTSSLSWTSLAAGAILLAVSALMNRFGVRRTWPYLLVGAALWLAFLKSGVHATIAGVLLAFTVPFRPVRGAGDGELTAAAGAVAAAADDAARLAAARALAQAAQRRSSPGYTLEQALHLPVLLAIMPLFALANAGVALSSAPGVGDRVAVGVFLGLLLGKPIGVLLGSWLAVVLGLGRLPADLRWRHLHGAAWLAGIGFTMSLFITGLAFADPSAQASAAKTAILAASTVAALVGLGVLWWGARQAPAVGHAAAPAPAAAAH